MYYSKLSRNICGDRLADLKDILRLYRVAEIVAMPIGRQPVDGIVWLVAYVWSVRGLGTGTASLASLYNVRWGIRSADALLFPMAPTA